MNLSDLSSFEKALYKQFGLNAGYALELWERYRQNAASVNDDTRRFFDNLSSLEGKVSLTEAPPVSSDIAQGVSPVQAAAAANLAYALRNYGHMAAQLDPLGTPPPGDPWLVLAYHEIDETCLEGLPAEVVGGYVGERAANAREAIDELRRVYSSGTGYEYGHIRIPEERAWLRRMAESGEFTTINHPIDPLVVLERLTQVEAFEIFLHRAFPGKTRFSIEGLDSMVLMLDELVGCAAGEQICTIAIGMAHRGRLNVLAHILGKPYSHILAEFKDPLGTFTSRNELGWTGDVKYHKGALHTVTGEQDREEVRLVIGMPPNPSHLEHVNPVVVGMARAAGSKVDRPGPPEFFPNACLPLLVHGDASFVGQGVVAETLNLSRLPGYTVGGALHIIANNQLGYTTLPMDSRSTLHASDLAKGFQIPIIHVNADQPEACIEAIRTAFAYRQEFGKDFLIDLIGYRRYGHNEGDEPGFTQPRIYAVIDEHPTVRKLWADRLIASKQIPPERPEALLKEQLDTLQTELQGLQPAPEVIEPQLAPPPAGAARKAATAVPLETLSAINTALLQKPEGFRLHRKLERAFQRRASAFDDPAQASIDWALAEQMAFATILADGTPIRLTGEDTERGTFSHRHAVLHDPEDGRAYTPLHAFPQARASFEVVNSPLSEAAAIGFEFGYDIQSQNSLVIWEAQYGDFINTAQAIIDEFVLSARAKWEQTPALVLLLPHGYEGQGPDHSSGRAERFLELADDQVNLRLANCTTAAQYFHLLRRQAALLKTDPLPLIVLTPKSLLRHPMVASTPRDLAEGHWQPVIDDLQAHQAPESVRRLILCSGKVYIDLVSAPEHAERPDIAIVRVEQLYPFPEEELLTVVDSYPALQEVFWLQEEPENMGAWPTYQARLERLLAGRLPLRGVARQVSASPAEGSAAWHTVNQKALVQQAYQRDGAEEIETGSVQHAPVEEG